ncbi:ATP-binding response regulator [Acuticoccus sediminis]|uniref:ATP-binding response regulator n=1 Tax=Acuticoccus sediminis TaxID=2184697 RepID=UPI001CFDD92E|nr:response regulator [Acuticoccus sediminis]
MSPARIAIVEDDRIVARDIREQLRRSGYEVVGTAASGEGAREMVARERPDLVLMDIRLEGAEDGIEAAQRVRRDYRVPVIFLTAYADDDTVRRATEAEPFGYLLKPFEDQQLRTAIEMALYKHRAERRLEDSERRYATTLASIGDAVIATDPDARITFMNPVAEALTGWTVAEAAGAAVTEVFRIINEDSRETVEDPVAKVLRLGTVVGLANHTLLIARDGREVPIDDCGSPIIDDAGEISGAVLVFRDITERRQMDEALREAQNQLALVARLTRLGELAASIAHEVNQPLTAIMSNAETCLRYLDEARAAAERMVGNSARAGEVVKSIRSLASRSTPALSPVDINELVRDVVDLLRGDVRRSGTTLRLELESGLARVTGDGVQLQQVLLNLVTNALEALVEVPEGERIVRVQTAMEGTCHVTVTVEDSGPGLDASLADKIFEPLYTTKRDGMGLGLSICRSIVEAHGGRIGATRRDAAQRGTVFVFTIPVRNDAD